MLIALTVFLFSAIILLKIRKKSISSNRSAINKLLANYGISPAKSDEERVSLLAWKINDNIVRLYSCTFPGQPSGMHVPAYFAITLAMAQGLGSAVGCNGALVALATYELLSTGDANRNPRAAMSEEVRLAYMRGAMASMSSSIYEQLGQDNVLVKAQEYATHLLDGTPSDKANLAIHAMITKYVILSQTKPNTSA